MAKGRGGIGRVDTERRSFNALRVRSSSEHPLLLEDRATVWDDSMQPAMAVRTTGSSPPDFDAFGPSGNLLCYTFAGAITLEQCYFSIQIPHSYKVGSPLYPHVHWTPTNANSGNVVWQFEYSVAKIGGVFGAPTTVATVPTAAGGVAWKHKVTSFRRIVDTSLGISSILIGRLFRDYSHSSDTYESDVSFLGFDIHYEIDTLGSREEYVK